MNLPAEMRGKELSLTDIETYFTGMSTYQVKKFKKFFKKLFTIRKNCGIIANVVEILPSGYGTYRSLNTDAVSTERMVGFLNGLSELGVVVTTSSM